MTMELHELGDFPFPTKYLGRVLHVISCSVCLSTSYHGMSFAPALRSFDNLAEKAGTFVRWGGLDLRTFESLAANYRAS